MISLNILFNSTTWKHKLWLYKNTLKYFIIRIYYFNKKIIFCYGSIGDTFIMIQHCKAFLTEYPDYKLMGSTSYKQVFRIFGIANDKILVLNEDLCISIHNYYYYAQLQNFNFSNQNFLNLNVNLYKDIRKMIINSEISMNQALLKIAPVKNKYLKEKHYPVYSEFDKEQVKIILSKFGEDMGKIILINPIAYTHKPFSRNEWSALAKILEEANFKVIFNIKNNNSSPIHDEWLGCQNAINVPAHLLPLLSQNIRLTLARPGGGFDLCFGYSKNSDVLIFLFKKEKIYKEQLSNHQEVHIKNLMNERFEKFVNVIEIDEEFNPKTAGRKVLEYLNDVS